MGTSVFHPQDVLKNPELSYSLATHEISASIGDLTMATISFATAGCASGRPSGVATTVNSYSDPTYNVAVMHEPRGTTTGIGFRNTCWFNQPSFTFSRTPNFELSQ